MVATSLKYLLQNNQLPEIEITRLTLDSREVQPGSLFFAYPGVNKDGRDFIEQAIAQKAAAIVYDNSSGFEYKAPTQVPLIAVPGLRDKVSQIAARFYDNPSQMQTIIGVTGTNGKTSITHFIAQAFSLQQIPCGLIGTLGWGVLGNINASTHTTPSPIQAQQYLSALKQQAVDTVAMEVSSHALDQVRLSGVAFDIAIFSQISRDHLDYHGDFNAYACAKERLFQMPGLKHAVINADDELGLQWIKKYQSTLNIVAYGLGAKVTQFEQFIAANQVKQLDVGYSVEIDSSWGQGTLMVPLFGEFNISNVLAVLAILLLSETPLPQALAHCSKLHPVSGRMQTFGGSEQPQVVVDYAHTPDALEKTLAALRAHCQGQLWCVFGCGGDRDQGKRPLMGEVADKLADHIVITNDNPRNEAAEVIAAEISAGMQQSQRVKTILNRAEAIQSVVQSAKINDIVLIAGKGHETVQVVGEQTFPFDDAEQVINALAQKR